MPFKNVSVIIISCPILRGELKDFYSNYFINELCSLGFTVGKISILEENESLIVSELVSLLRKFDFVFLVGRLEPGVTNVIYKATANIFKEELISNQELNSALADLHKNCVTESLVPATAKILRANSNNCSAIKVHPVIYLQRLFIISNDESTLQIIFHAILKPFLDLLSDDHRFTRSICMQYNEKYLNIIKDLQKASDVKVTVEKQNSKLLIKIQSSLLNNVLEAENAILTEGRSELLYCEETDTNNCLLYQQINGLPHIKQAISYIEECFSTYGPDNFFLSFNGGKDCTVLLHLVLVVLRRNYPDYKKPMPCLYVQSPHPFEEVDNFIAQVEQYYNLKISTFAKNIKDSLASILETENHMKACFMGTRRTDPFCSDLQVFQMTDKGWPQVMRVNPLLDWHYSDIWDYLLMFQVPYCILYDQGYTSLGSRTNTHPNPDLMYCDISGKQSYLPAYKLFNGSQERSGRMARAS